tara:strand:+ start:9811 stop:10068 length:258 start_codon:yes stop_codon:yes gene_type:complete
MANYRQQTGGTLGTSQTCPTCSTQLILCYATTANTVCCGTSTTATVYVAAGATFATATLLYSDAALTTIAAAGYYSTDAGTCTTP